ncbi:MAG: MMPL family transporter [Clostridia bacterium]|nr:MMPL family transporter [Clostridia bacterium]
MNKIAKFIVEKRALFFVLFAALIIYAIIGIPKVGIEYSITSYLPKDTDTAKALEIMDEEFVTYGATKIMISNITYERAESLYEEIKEYDGVKSFSFKNSSDYYKDSCALFNITFDGNNEDEASKAAFERIKKRLDGYDYCVPSPLVESFADILAKEMVVILAIAAAVIVLVLLFTSKSFAEILVFPIVFIVAALLNMGTNHWLGKISFISNSVCIVLQLALAIDYSIILCHRFTEEKEKLPGNASEAMTRALAKSIPEISSSSLTTVSGLVALMFMQLRLGYDLGMVLAKSIVCSLLTVFLLMPGLLMTFSGLMDKSRHRNFVPKINFLGRGIVKIRYILLPVFLIVFSLAAFFSQRLEYVYSEAAIDTARPTDTMIAARRTEEVFGYDNMFVILVPKGDYEKERLVLDTVESEEMISSALGIANIEITDGYYLSDTVTYRDFSEMFDISERLSLNALRLYAVANGDYWALTGNKMDEYGVTIIELLDYLFEHDEYLDLDSEQRADFDELKTTLKDGEAQLIGENYTRLIFNIDGALESESTFALIERLIPAVKAIYPDAIFAGESMSAYDLNDSFVSDNLLINILTVAFIYLILMFTFRSWGIPIVLVLVIQGAIFMNFAYPVLLGNNLFFFVYLIVSAIQMGATIDYAIVITNRFRELRKEGTEKKQAVIETLSQSFPTIFTSGSIMTVAAFLIGFLTSQPLIASIGLCLGRGTLISILCVMTVLPALLYVLDKPLDKTVFKKREKKKRVKQQTIFTRISAYLDALKNVPLPAGGNALLPPVETDTEGDGEQECGEDEERERKTPNEGTKRQKERHGKEERQ